MIYVTIALFVLRIFLNIHDTGRIAPRLYEARQRAAIRQSERGVHVAPARADRLGLQPVAPTKAK